MRSLPIFKGEPANPFDGIMPLQADPSCNRCSHKGTKATTCLPWEGEPGGLLVVQDFPSAADARSKKHLSTAVGAHLKAAAHKAGMEAAFTAALRCVPKSGAAIEQPVALVPGLTACLPYLAQTIAEVKPRKIVALGAAAIHSLTGGMIPPSTNRGAFSWVHFAHGWVPVFYAISPDQADKNKFLREWLLADFPVAVHAQPSTMPPIEGMGWAECIETVEDAQACLSSLATARWTAVDCEWAGRPYDKDFKLLSVAMTPAPPVGKQGPDLTDAKANNAYVWTRPAIENPEIRTLLCGWLRDPQHRKVGSYFKADTVALHAALGIWTRGVTFDTRLLRRLMDAEASGKLADMAHLVGRGGHKDELKEAMQKAVTDYKKAASKGVGLFRTPLPGLADKSHCDKLVAGAPMELYGFACVNPDLLYRYNAADTVVTALVGALLEDRLSKEPQGMQHVAQAVAIPAGDTYARVESWGVHVDRDGLETLGTYLDQQLAEVCERFKPYGYGQATCEGGVAGFNPGSPKDIGQLLFDVLKLKSEKTTDRGAPSTDAEALEALADQHPVVKDLLAWRGLSKIKGTYVESLLGYIRDNGRIHPTIHPDGARTGRTSSSAPNLQTMPSIESSDPVQAQLARMLKDCFRPPDRHSLLEVDYSQLELRVAADLSGDPAMLQIFKDGLDFHMQTARLLSKTLWNLEPDQVTDTHRREVKPYAFGLLYDDSPYGLAMRLGVPEEKAEQIKEAVFGCFPLLARWIKQRVAETAKTGHAWTWWAGQPARRRPLIEVANLDSPMGKTARRGSWNTPIQGTGNEYLVASAVKVVEWLVGDGIPAKLLVTIHDSMLLEVRNDCMSEVRDTVLSIMASHQTKNGVPLVADAKCGPTWAQMVKWKAGQPCPLPGCT